jgi:hypothetical protein
MQVGSFARRIRVAFDDITTPEDGVLAGLVKMGEVALEAHTIDVPTFNRIVKIQSGIVTMPEIQLTYETNTETNTRQYLKNWWINKDQKNMTVIMVDATGTEQERVLWSSVEISRLTEPEADLANPTYAQMVITVLPKEITPIDL